MKRLKIAFLHPDLGIGGAERLMVDAAVELVNQGHEVTIFTGRYDPCHCLEKTRNPMLTIKVAGNFVPHGLSGRFRVPCAIARMMVMALAMKQASRCCDVMVCDLVPHVIPFYRLISRAKILFYGHYPDVLLAPQKKGLYRVYRVPVNGLERFGMRFAHQILVNSEFTARTFKDSFPYFSRKPPKVLYPGVDIPQFLTPAGSGPMYSGLTDKGRINLLSINRFAPEKNLALALDALAALRGTVSPETFHGIQLIMAGACDERLPEQRQTLDDLKAQADQLNLHGQVVFLSSISDSRRLSLLKDCDIMVYTSVNEHFGIGIVEAMAAGKPVIAVNRGGPKETVVNGLTGFLCDPAAGDFARAMKTFIADPARAADMGKAAQKRAQALFSMPVFGRRLENILLSLVNGDRPCLSK